MAARSPEGVSIATRRLGGAEAEVLEPAGPIAGQALLLHGGGFVAGTPAHPRGLFAAFARLSRLRTIAPSYRLAPEHPFPAGLDDVVAAYLQLLDSGCDPATLLVGGESAGGGLCLGLLVRLREAGLPLPAGAILWWPWVDLSLSGESVMRNAGHDILTPDLLAGCAEAYCPDADARTRTPVSPVFADLGGLPPVLVQVGGRDLLADDSRRLAERLRQAEVDVRLDEWPGLPHGFALPAMEIPSGGEAVAAGALWARDRLDAARDPFADLTSEPDRRPVNWVRRENPQPSEVALPGSGGRIPVRLLGRTESPRAVYVRFHGGGWIGGAHDADDAVLHQFGEGLGIAVASIGYRLAFPAAVADCVAAALWAAQAFPEVFVGGESAGAHLAVLTLLQLRDRHGYTACRGADLRYGMYDLRLTPSARSGGAGGPSAEILDETLDRVLGTSGRDRAEVSPIFADLAGLPPALFTCGTADSLLDDTLFMWARWRAAGNDAELKLYPGAPHSFDFTATATATHAWARAAEFIEARLARTVPLPGEGRA